LYPSQAPPEALKAARKAKDAAALECDLQAADMWALGCLLYECVEGQALVSQEGEGHAAYDAMLRQLATLVSVMIPSICNAWAGPTLLLLCFQI
jgi:hypothetical protein